MGSYLERIIDMKRFIVNTNPPISKQIQDCQYDTLQRLVADCFCANMITCEIGSFTGLSAVLIGEVVQRAKGTHYCIDWWKGNPQGQGGMTKEVMEQFNVAQQFRDNIEFFNLTDTIKQIICKSNKASSQFENEYFDFIFIDGDHSTPAIIEDFDLYYPKLKKGKVISGHDFSASINAIDEIYKKYRLPIYKENDIWWLTKPK